ncbi:MAG: TonB-dependent receptor plug [Puniceicoccaceae bacterium 5H]|nr:MAG: TonB-dependent receptor plug [Puniceicoccaceae bacterium 5H]
MLMTSLLPYPARRLAKPRYLTTLLACVLCATPAWAQDDNSDEEEIIELPAFEIVTGKDDRYLSPVAQSGTPINMAIRDAPLSLETVNAEFIGDLQAVDSQEALAYSAGVFLESFENTSTANSDFESRDRSPSSSASSDAPFTNQVIIRGYSVPNQQRFGFRIGSIVPAYGVVIGGSTDSVNTERLEVVRGPASLLYGINVLSGVVNVLPRKPVGQFGGEASVSVGSYDFFRSTLDVTGPLTDTLNYRMAAAYTEEGDWTDYLLDKKQYYVGQLDWTPVKKVNLFLEAQYSKSRREGGGQQFFVDGGSINAQDFYNEYDERYTFGRDYFNEGTFTDDKWAGRTDPLGNELLGETYLVEKPGVDYTFPVLDPGTRLSGPDVYREQKEYSLLSLLNVQPFEGMEVEMGAYYTHTEVEERNVSMAVVTNGQNTVNLNRIKLNPEGADGIWAGIGELFQTPDNRSTAAEDAPAIEDVRFARYFWYKEPTEADSLQLRFRSAYTFDTNFFDGDLPIEHALVVGVNYIQDEMSFVTGGVSDGNVFTFEQGNESNNRFADDPYHLRNIFDYSVIHYNGEALAIPGYLTTSSLEGIDDTSEDYIVQSGWRDATLWYKGRYFAYQGQFWGDRANLVAGVRQDAYQVKEAEQLRVVDRDYVTDEWIGSGTEAGQFPVIDRLIGYGDQPYVWQDDLPDSLNAGIEQSIERLRAEQPNGTVSYNFPEDQKFTTKFYGLSVRVLDPVSVFYVHSEGVFPNTGQRDGAYQPIDAEQTTNDEIGVKFELMEGKISGSLGVFRIKRENAVWNWLSAPNPAAWASGPLGTSDSFSPDEIRAGNESIKYGVGVEYVVQAFEEAGIELPVRRKPTGSTDPDQYQFSASDFEEYGVVVVGKRPWNNPESPTADHTYFFIDYELMKSVENNPLTRAMDIAIRDQAAAGNPINYFGPTGETYNASQTAVSPGANVTYEEEGTGFDGNIIYSPNDNYQVVFTFSKQNREVVGTGFNLAPGYQVDGQGDQVGDEIWTTEYDVWVYQLGPDAFEDPSDPTTLKSSALNGADLSFVPEYSLRLWNRYNFNEGPLEGLAVGGGVRWNSSIPTTAGVGGQELAINRYPTPDIPARAVVDLFTSYRTEIWDREWTFSLIVNNVLDDHEVDEVAVYDVEDGDPIKRRTHLYYDPVSFRLNVSMRF